jgi:magnesium-transporting ATPase (P-type)
VLTELRASAQGLEEDDAARRLAAYGANRLPEPPKRSAALRLLLQFHNVLIYVLLGAAAVTFALDHITDTLVILAVVILNAVIGFLQEGKAEKAMGAIRRMLALQAAVMRAGQRRTVEGEALVPGDIVLLEAGDKVPADLRLLHAAGLQVQEAILTGESVPVEKGLEACAADAPLGDRSCMAYSGTLVTSGLGRGIVVATAGATQIGRISSLLERVETLTTPLVRQMNVFARWLTILILCVAGALLAFGYFVAHLPFADLFITVVSLSVAAIPEGLPAVLTITLAVGVQAMARRNVIVRRLPAIETLGSVSVICTDKTGTLTRNEMVVASLVTGEGVFAVHGDGYAPSGAVTRGGAHGEPSEQSALAELGRVALLCNDAALREHDGVWGVEGDPMEGALLALAGKLGFDVCQEQRDWPRTDVIPFDARRRFMATLNHDHEGHGLVLVKGAPERLLAMCEAQRIGAGTAPLDEAWWHERAEKVAAQGQRVLGLAMRAMRPQQTVLELADVEGTLTLIGLVGLIDPPRPEAIEAVRDCHAAGIRVKMITGDHKGTAAAIARQIGLRNTEAVLTGTELDALDDVALIGAARETDVFARTSPEQKLRLVTALQSAGEIVAMTGDGVNDAPALKRADAGIAMGKKGSEAAKEAAQLVLLDDNFASIAAAVREGRTAYDNIKKVISWTLPTNGGEAATVIAALALGLTLPVAPIQILWINLVTAVTLGLALAFEPTEAGTMRRPPRSRGEPLLSGRLVWHIVLVAALFLFAAFGVYEYAVDRGYSIELARTMTVNTIVVLEIFHLFFVRNIYSTSLNWAAVRGTKVVWLTVCIVTAAQFALTYLGPLQRIFATEPVPVLDGFLIVAVGAVFFAFIEIEKQLHLTFARRPG